MILQRLGLIEGGIIEDGLDLAQREVEFLEKRECKSYYHSSKPQNRL